MLTQTALQELPNTQDASPVLLLSSCSEKKGLSKEWSRTAIKVSDFTQLFAVERGALPKSEYDSILSIVDRQPHQWGQIVKVPLL
jgi:hypothetical protein